MPYFTGFYSPYPSRRRPGSISHFSCTGVPACTLRPSIPPTVVPAKAGIYQTNFTLMETPKYDSLTLHSIPLKNGIQLYGRPCLYASPFHPTHCRSRESGNPSNQLYLDGNPEIRFIDSPLHPVEKRDPVVQASLPVRYPMSFSDFILIGAASK
jgi:hypothetical protein